MLDTSTAPADVDLRRVHRMRALRRVFVVLLCAFLLAGLLGVFGVRSRTVTASADGYTLTVTYASAARPGLAAPWTVEVTKEGGFDKKTVKVSTTGSYFAMFDENSLDPDPSASTTEGEDIVWEFDAPEGDTLTIDFDARIGPSVQSLWPPEAVTAVLEGQRRVVEVRYRTRVWP
jgi:hypothetical protein